MKRMHPCWLSLFLAGTLVTAGAATSLPRSAPELQGVSSTGLLELVRALDQRIDGMHSLMLVRHGHVIAEGWWTPYRPERKHVLYSLSKSFTSSAVGFAVAEGLMSIDDPVMRFFPDELPPEPSAHLRAMRVRDILTMTTGHQDEPPTLPAEISARSFLAQAVPHLPGTHFKYNTAATFLQSAIVQKLTGQTVLDYLRPRLFEPLGIADPVWDTNFQGISLGGYGMRIRTEDIAKFGQLYLQRGQWQGQQLLPAEWVDLATSRQVSNGSNPASDWNQGYGFQFWRCRHGAYRGDGAFGQYCVVVPELDLVIAITSGVSDMQAVLNIVWDRLLPACQPGALPANPAAHRDLQAALAALVLAPAQGAGLPEAARRHLDRRFVFPDNADKIGSIRLSFGNDGVLLMRLEVAGQPVELPCGYRRWLTSRAPGGFGRVAVFTDEPVAGTFGWEDEDTVRIKLAYFETPFLLDYRIHFHGADVELDGVSNVAFGPRERPRLTGRAE